MKAAAEQIFLSGVESVLPDKMIQSQIKIRDNHLHLADLSFPLGSIGNLYVLGAGKASALMAKGLEAAIGERITEGHIIVKYGHTYPLHKIKISEAGHPVPDQSGINATASLLKLAEKAKENDLVICLISGGASSLLADYPDGSNLDELTKVNQLLIKSGADIREMNTVRKHLSQVKGGQLAKAIYPATFVSLILSDVIGDPVDVIASGPTSPDPTSFDDALNVLEKYDLLEQFPPSMIRHLQEGCAHRIPETPKAEALFFTQGYNRIIGSNRTALEAAGKKALEYGFQPYLVTSTLEGNLTEAADFILDTALRIQKDSKFTRPVCLLAGGEPTIKVTGKGLGGRNQHLALYSAIKIKGMEGLTLLCAGTDGNDGPTDAAGAVVDGRTAEKALQIGLDPQNFLEACDSYHFFKQAGGHIVTGSTMTNVMDLMVVIIE